MLLAAVSLVLSVSKVTLQYCEWEPMSSKGCEESLYVTIQ